MNIEINLLEVASELAHEKVCARLEDDSNEIYENVSDIITHYTDIFNEWYDYYYDFLLKLKN